MDQFENSDAIQKEEAEKEAISFLTEMKEEVVVEAE